VKIPAGKVNMPAQETVRPTTFEAAIDGICLSNGVPSEVKKDLIILMIELIGWETACQLNPSIRISGNPTREHKRTRRAVKEAMKGKDIPGLYPVGKDDYGNTIINPIYLLPASSSDLESRKTDAIAGLQEVLVRAANPNLKAKRDKYFQDLQDNFQSYVKMPPAKLVKQVRADMSALGVAEPKVFLPNDNDKVAAAAAEMVMLQGENQAPLSSDAIFLWLRSKGMKLADSELERCQDLFNGFQRDSRFTNEVLMPIVRRGGEILLNQQKNVQEWLTELRERYKK